MGEDVKDDFLRLKKEFWLAFCWSFFGISNTAAEVFQFSNWRYDAVIIFYQRYHAVIIFQLKVSRCDGGGDWTGGGTLSFYLVEPWKLIFSSQIYFHIFLGDTDPNIPWFG